MFWKSSYTQGPSGDEIISSLSFYGSSFVFPLVATHLEYLHGWGLYMHHTFTEVNMATVTTGEVTGSLIYGLMLKSVCGGRRQICERVMLKRRKRRK